MALQNIAQAAREKNIPRVQNASFAVAKNPAPGLIIDADSYSGASMAQSAVKRAPTPAPKKEAALPSDATINDIIDGETGESGVVIPQRSGMISRTNLQSQNPAHNNIIKNIVSASQNNAHLHKVGWQSCRFLKIRGDREFCTEYLCWCMKEKCPMSRR